MPRTSGISEQMITTAAPSRASWLMSWYTSTLAPTSMPRVGSSKMKMRALEHSHLAMTTFCWFPPDRWPTIRRMSGGRMVRSFTS